VRSFAEFLVIFVGVVVALAADRWLAAQDQASEAAFYEEQLVRDLRADSALFSQRMDALADRARGTLVFPQVAAGLVPEDSPVAIATVPFFEALGAFEPVAPNRDAWDDLVSTGSVSLLSRGLRQSLSSYYNDLKTLHAAELEWDRAMRLFEVRAWSVGDQQLRRLSYGDRWLRGYGDTVYDKPIDGHEIYDEPLHGERYSGPEPGAEDVRQIAEQLRADPVFHAALGTNRALAIWSAYLYGDVLKKSSDILASFSD